MYKKVLPLTVSKANNPTLKMDRGPEQTFLQRRHKNGQQVHEMVLNITDHQRNANQNHYEKSQLLECLLSKRQEITNVGKDVEKKDFGKNIDWCCY
jgi:hypothetical protein